MLGASGDSHVYLNHVDPLREQLERVPFPFPTLALNPAIKNIDDFTFQDFTLTGYESHAKIVMKMAV
jgi:thymidylate synthase